MENPVSQAPVECMSTKDLASYIHCYISNVCYIVAAVYLMLEKNKTKTKNQLTHNNLSKNKIQEKSHIQSNDYLPKKIDFIIHVKLLI